MYVRAQVGHLGKANSTIVNETLKSSDIIGISLYRWLRSGMCSALIPTFSCSADSR
jgi:hypothetical protein